MKVKGIRILLFTSLILASSNMLSQTNSLLNPLSEAGNISFFESFDQFPNSKNDYPFHGHQGNHFFQQAFFNNNFVDSVIVQRDGYPIKAKHTFDYDSNGRLTSHLVESWVETNWVNYWRESYTYDTNGNKKTALSELWDDRREGNYRLYNFTYDSDGRLTFYFYRIWDEIENNWGDFEFRFTYTYDSKGNLNTVLNDHWDGTNLFNNNRKTYNYDSTGHKISFLIERNDSTNMVNDRLESYSYDSAGYLASKLLQIWYDENWVNTLRETLINDSVGNISTHLKENWDETDWFYNSRSTFSYNSFGNLESELIETFILEKWVANRRKIYNYNSSNNIMSFLYEFWNGSIWGTSNSNGSFSFNSNAQQYSFNGYLIEIFYKPITDIEEKTAQLKNYSLKQNYPNPFNPTTQINYEIAKRGLVQLIVYDLLGREVKYLVNANQERGTYKVDFHAYTLPSGVYFYKLVSENYIETKKMLLIR